MKGHLSDAELDLLEESHPEMKQGCPTCRGTLAYIWKDEKYICDCAQQRRLYTRYARAGIGLNYMRLDWDDVMVPPEQLAPVRDYLAKLDANVAAGMGLFLSGSTGSGKTLVEMLVIKELVNKDHDCYVTTFVGAIDEFAATWRDNAEKQRFAHRFEYSRILGIDDVGKEYSNKLSGHTLDRILRTRNQEARPTIVTTNLSSGQVYQGYGPAVLSLLVEQSIEVPLVGADFRIKARTRKVVEIERGWTRPIT